MATTRCPAGHETVSLDYCDVCGVPLGGAAAPSGGSTPASAPASAAAPPAPPPAPPAPAPANTGPLPASKPCASCGAANPGDALFCESCGYDFTTGQLPPPVAARAASSLDLGPTPSTGAPAPPASTPAAAGADWMAEIWVDPAWIERNRAEATDPCPAAGAPRIAPLPGTGALIGRPSSSRHAAPQVDCTPDSSVSRKHAQLLLDGDRWYVEDLGSTNGTYVGGASATIPDDPIPSGQRRELGENDRIYVGAWTRIVVRRATTTEKTA
jgi:hypothetical protein